MLCDATRFLAWISSMRASGYARSMGVSVTCGIFPPERQRQRKRELLRCLLSLSARSERECFSRTSPQTGQFELRPLALTAEHDKCGSTASVLSYNGTTNSVNWVSWQLKASDLEKPTGPKVKRGPFIPDPLLPKGFAQLNTKIYSNGGFDRGHQCPFADRSNTQENADATMFLSNIIPQAPDLNRRTWEHLEAYCRTLAKKGQRGSG